MSTDYTVECRSGGRVATIKIIDSWVPINDTWEGTAADWGAVHGGSVASWGTEDLRLSSGIPSSPHVLYKFGKGIETGATGSGLKQSLDGSFPDGDFAWRCTRVD